MAERLRPEMNQWGGDTPSFGTLTFSLPPASAAVAPSGLTAYLVNGQVLLSWWGSAYATAYEVQRAPAASGPAPFHRTSTRRTERHPRSRSCRA